MYADIVLLSISLSGALVLVPEIYLCFCLSLSTHYLDQQQDQCSHQPQRAPHSGTLSVFLHVCLPVCLILHARAAHLTLTTSVFVRLPVMPLFNIEFLFSLYRLAHFIFLSYTDIYFYCGPVDIAVGMCTFCFCVCEQLYIP